MIPEIGEYIVGAYLREMVACDVIDYSARPPGGGLEGLAELDVVGMKITATEAYLCEVTTHQRGLNYGSYQETFQRIRAKHARQRAYAHKHLRYFKRIHYMFWSPIVPKGLADALGTLRGLELVINDTYTARMGELRQKAATTEHDTGNPFFRALQILEHLRMAKPPSTRRT